MDRLRFLADNDTAAFKKVMYVVILKDLAEWSKFMGNDCTYKQLIKKIDEYILRNPEFIIDRTSNTSAYVNVNTPQTNITWQRVWDDPSVIYNREYEKPINPKDYSYTEDPTCKPSIVYFDSLDEIGEPKVDRSKLSVCEKMNIFIDRTTGQAWYIKEDGNWAVLKGQADSVDWENVINHPEIYQGIRHEVTDNATVKVELLVDGESSDEGVKVATADDLEDVL